jgi:hypothetical protein
VVDLCSKYALRSAGEDHPTKHIDEEDGPIDWLEIENDLSAHVSRSDSGIAVDGNGNLPAPSAALPSVEEEESLSIVRIGSVNADTPTNAKTTSTTAAMTPVTGWVIPDVPPARTIVSTGIRYDPLLGIYRYGIPDNDIRLGDEDDEQSSDSDDDDTAPKGSQRRVKFVSILGVTSISLGVARRLAPHANVTLARTSEPMMDELETEMTGVLTKWSHMRLSPVSLPTPPVRSMNISRVTSAVSPQSPVVPAVTSPLPTPNDGIVTVTPAALSYVPVAPTDSNIGVGVDRKGQGDNNGGDSPERPDLRTPLLFVDTNAPRQRAMSLTALLSPVGGGPSASYATTGSGSAGGITLSHALTSAMSPLTDTVIIMLPTDQWSYQAVKAIRAQASSLAAQKHNSKHTSSDGTNTSGGSRVSSMFSTLSSASRDYSSGAPAPSSHAVASTASQPSGSSSSTLPPYTGPRLVVMIHDSSFASHFRRLDCWVIYAGAMLADSISHIPFLQGMTISISIAHSPLQYGMLIV